MDINETLAQRATTHGPFVTTAELSQRLKFAISNNDAWQRMPATQREALEMIQHKIARIVCGDCLLIDSWRDVVGYAQLVVNELYHTTGAADVVTTRVTLGDSGVWE